MTIADREGPGDMAAAARLIADYQATMSILTNHSRQVRPAGTAWLVLRDAGLCCSAMVALDLERAGYSGFAETLRVMYDRKKGEEYFDRAQYYHDSLKRFYGAA